MRNKHMTARHVAVLASCVLTTLGCDQQRNAAQDLELANLKAQMDGLAKRVDSIEQARSLEELFRDSDKVAFLTPGAEGYSAIHSDLGPMTVSLQNIEAYANGSRVTLQFGNLTSATINGAKVKIEWGRVDEKGIPNNDTARSRDVTFTQSLTSGRWTNTQVVLDGVPPTDLGFVRVREFGHSGITLNR